MVQVRQQFQVVAHFQLDLLLGQHLAHRHQGEVGMGRQELLGDKIVFFVQEAAGGVHQAAAALDQARRAGQDGCLLGLQFDDGVRLLAPFHVRIAAQGAQAAARGIDQHAVDLAGQALDLGIALMRDLHRMHVRQAAAGHARLQLGQTLFRHVERIQTARVAHQRAQCQGLAARAGTEINHHLATLGADDLRQDLAAFILHFDGAALEQRHVLQRRLLDHAQAQRRIGRRGAEDRCFGQSQHHVFARRLERIDAQVQRRRRVQRIGQLHGFRFAELGDQLVEQPGRHVGAHVRRHQAAVDLRDALQPFHFFFRQAAQRIGADGFGQAEDGQTTHGGATARFGEIGKERFVAQYGINAFGDGAAFARTEARMVAEIARQGRVGRGRET